MYQGLYENGIKWFIKHTFVQRIIYKQGISKVSAKIFTKENIKILVENRFLKVYQQEMIVFLVSVLPKNLREINSNLRFLINFI